MEKVKCWSTDIICGVVSFFCWFSDLLMWFTPDHCDHIAKITAMLIGIATLLFITIPKAMPNIRCFLRFFRSIF